MCCIKQTSPTSVFASLISRDFYSLFPRRSAYNCRHTRHTRNTMPLITSCCRTVVICAYHARVKLQLSERHSGRSIERARAKSTVVVMLGSEFYVLPDAEREKEERDGRRGKEERVHRVILRWHKTRNSALIKTLHRGNFSPSDNRSIGIGALVTSHPRNIRSAGRNWAVSLAQVSAGYCNGNWLRTP